MPFLWVWKLLCLLILNNYEVAGTEFGEVLHLTFDGTGVCSHENSGATCEIQGSIELVNGVGASGNAVRLQNDAAIVVSTPTEDIMSRRCSWSITSWIFVEPSRNFNKADPPPALFSAPGEEQHVTLAPGGEFSSFSELYDKSSLSLSSLSGGWHHVACVGYYNEQKLYVDGVFVGDVYPVHSPVRYIGNARASERAWGVIDDVRIFDRRLTEAEIQQLVTDVDIKRVADVDVKRVADVDADGRDATTGGNSSGAFAEDNGIETNKNSDSQDDYWKRKMRIIHREKDIENENVVFAVDVAERVTEDLSTTGCDPSSVNTCLWNPFADDEPAPPVVHLEFTADVLEHDGSDALPQPSGLVCLNSGTGVSTCTLQGRIFSAPGPFPGTTAAVFETYSTSNSRESALKYGTGGTDDGNSDGGRVGGDFNEGSGDGGTGIDGVRGEVGGSESVTDKVDGIDGVTDKVDGIEGVTDKVYGIDGVRGEVGGSAGVKDEIDGNELGGSEGLTDKVDGSEGVKDEVGGGAGMKDEVDESDSVKDEDGVYCSMERREETTDEVEDSSMGETEAEADTLHGKRLDLSSKWENQKANSKDSSGIQIQGSEGVEKEGNRVEDHVRATEGVEVLSVPVEEDMGVDVGGVGDYVQGDYLRGDNSPLVRLTPATSLGKRWTVAAWIKLGHVEHTSGSRVLASYSKTDEHVALFFGDRFPGSHVDQFGSYSEFQYPCTHKPALLPIDMAVDVFGGKSGWKASRMQEVDSRLNSWHHVAIVAHGTQAICYVNGTRVGDTPYVVDTGIDVVGNTGAHSQPLGGAVFDFRVYDEALSSLQLKQVAFEYE